jgi:hypothetical protein
MLLTAGAGVMLAAMAAVMPATATAAPPGQRYTWTTIKVPSSVATVPATVNDQGVVVGEYYATSSDLKNGVSQGFIDQAGTYTTIDYAGATSSAVYGMTNSGEIVGTYLASDGVQYGFIDQGGTFTTLKDPNADTALGPSAPYAGTAAYGVDDSGEIVGWYVDSTETVHGFVYQGGSFTTEDCPGAGTGLNPNTLLGFEGSGFGFVDNFGTATGTCWESNKSQYNFIYQNGRFNRVPNVPGSSDTIIAWVIKSGVSGGWYTRGHVTEGYIYQNGRFTTIKDPLGRYGIYLDGANDFGAIAGAYYDHSGNTYGFVMTPSH